MLLVDNVDSKEYLTQLFNLMYYELPTHDKEVMKSEIESNAMKIGIQYRNEAE